MPDYKKMYTTLFNAVTDAISSLQNSQQITEEIYISGEDPIISIASPTNDEERKDNDCSQSPKR